MFDCIEYIEEYNEAWYTPFKKEGSTDQAVEVSWDGGACFLMPADSGFIISNIFSH